METMIKPELSSNAKEVVLVANTPSFLLRQMQRDPAVQFIVESVAPDKLFSYFSNSLCSENDRAEALVEKYICLIALGAMNAPQVWKKVHGLNLSCLQWGEAIVALIDASKSSAFSVASPQPTAPFSYPAAPHSGWFPGFTTHRAKKSKH